MTASLPRATSIRHQGSTLIFRPDSSVGRGLTMVHRDASMVISEHLVGRADELGSIERVLAELDRGEPTALVSSGSPGSARLDCSRSSSERAEARDHLVLAGSASELERDVPFWVFVDALDEYLRGLDPAALDRRWTTDVRAELAQVFPALPALAAPGGGAPERALPHAPRRSHPARASLRRRSLSCSSSTTFTGRTRAPSELLGALLHRPPVGAPSSSRSRCVPARCPSGSRFARAGAPRRDADACRAGHAHPRARPRSCWARTATARRRPRSTRRAAATPSTSSSSPGR